MEPAFRRAARLVVVDGRWRVFLLQYEDGGRKWWATPGGGLEDGESFEDAAAREATEELSLTGITLAPLWRQTVDFTFRGRAIRQVEQYFMIRLWQHESLSGAVVGEVHARESIVDGRWWSVEELEMTSEEVLPEDLRQRLAGLRDA